MPRALYLSHGGGPLPLLGDPAHQEMVDCLQRIAADLPRPEAIVVVSAHWEEPQPTITAQSQPGLLYDYSRFPPESYNIPYPCPGAPALARDLQGLLAARGFDARLEESRRLDHGVFVPLKLMVPAADIPVVEVSLVSGLDPAVHIALGEALAGLAERKVLLIGSGFSFHNLPAFYAPVTEESRQLNEGFEAWLRHVCSDPDLPEACRREQLIRWSEAPGARFCHPREEHLLPLHVCYGAAQGACREVHGLEILHRQSSMILW